MKHLLYIINIAILFVVFASCKDDNSSIMPDDKEPSYTILVSTLNADTRATYKEDGENLAVVWEKGDVVYLGTNEFVFKEMKDDNKALFFHYGSIDGAESWTGTVSFGANSSLTTQLQKKNNVCREHLVANVSGIDLTSTPTIILLPANNNSLIHIQVKSPATFLGGSSLKVMGLDKTYTITLGEKPEHVFADKDDMLDIYFIVPSGMTIASGTEIMFIFSEYDEADDGDEYGYVIRNNTSASTANDEVLKLQLPNKTSRLMHVMGTVYSNLADGSVMSINGLNDSYKQTLDNYVKDAKYDFYMLLAKTDTVKSANPLNLTVLEPNDGDEFYYLNPKYNESNDGEVVRVKMGYPRAAIQMGLSVKWANVNIGAEQDIDYGNYFWWGDIEGHEDNSSYTFDTPGTTEFWNLTKLKARGYVGDDENLLPGKDAAVQLWGDEWKIPTKAECEELIANTKSVWQTYNGVNGRMWTSKINGKSVFMPAAGYYDEQGYKHDGTNGHYRTSTRVNNNNNRFAYKLGFAKQSIEINNQSYRYKGFSIRPVKTK